MIKDAAQFGKQKGHWNGFDFSVDARLRNDLYVQGGVGVGKTMSDVCEIADDVPEVMFSPFPPAGQAIQPGHPVHRQGYGRGAGCDRCAGRRNVDVAAATATRRRRGRLSTRRSASYTLPWYGVRVSGTWQSIVGPQIAALRPTARRGTASRRSRAATMTTLGRVLTNSASVLNVIEPGTCGAIG